VLHKVVVSAGDAIGSFPKRQAVDHLRESHLLLPVSGGLQRLSTWFSDSRGDCSVGIAVTTRVLREPQSAGLRGCKIKPAVSYSSMPGCI